MDRLLQYFATIVGWFIRLEHMRANGHGLGVSQRSGIYRYISSHSVSPDLPSCVIHSHHSISRRVAERSCRTPASPGLCPLGWSTIPLMTSPSSFWLPANAWPLL